MQSRLDEVEKLRAARADSFPLFAVGPGSCRRPPQKPEEAGASSGDGRYRFSLDVAGFALEELSVVTEGRRLVVRAQRRRKTVEADGRVSHQFRELRKQVLLPDDADLAALACTLRGERLCVEAPRGPAQPQPGPLAACRAPVGETKAALPASPEAAAGAAAAAAP